MPENDFIKKPVEQPILDAQSREQLAPEESEPAARAGGFKEFYFANKIYFWAISVGLVIIAVLAFFAFRGNGTVKPREAKLDFAIDSQQTVASGGEIIYYLKIKNNDSQKLTNLQVELTYPDGFTYIQSNPKAVNISETLFKVPDMLSGQDVVVIVRVKAVGNLNENKQLKAKLTYSLANFSSQFTKEQQFTTRLVASNVTLTLQGPLSSAAQQLVIYDLKYTNNSGNDLKNVRVIMHYPQGFVFGSSNPPADLSNDTWDISSLGVKGEGHIQVSGNFKSVSPGESKTATAELLILAADGSYYTQSTATFNTAIANTPLLVTQELERETDNDIVNPGENLNFKINFQNNASVVANGVNIIVTLNSKSLDLGTLQAEGALINNNTILWNASTYSQLENLSPSESGSVSFSVQVKNPATRDSSKNLTIVSSVKIKANQYETAFPGNDLTLKISSPSKISSNLSFVSGSLPPKVGTNTIYKVRLTLTNSTNDFSDTALSAFIPLGAGGFVAGSVNTAETARVDYDSTTGKLTWNVGSLLAHAGTFSQPRVLEFNVRLNPAAAQANQSVVLVKDIQMSARDTFTQGPVQVFTDDILTEDLSGSGFGNGTVQP